MPTSPEHDKGTPLLVENQEEDRSMYNADKAKPKSVCDYCNECLKFMCDKLDVIKCLERSCSVHTLNRATTCCTFTYLGASLSSVIGGGSRWATNAAASSVVVAGAVFWTNTAAFNKESAYADLSRRLIALEADIKIDDKFDTLLNEFKRRLPLAPGEEPQAAGGDAAQAAGGDAAQAAGDAAQAPAAVPSSAETWSEKWKEIDDEFRNGGLSHDEERARNMERQIDEVRDLIKEATNNFPEHHLAAKFAREKKEEEQREKEAETKKNDGDGQIELAKLRGSNGGSGEGKEGRWT